MNAKQANRNVLNYHLFKLTGEPVMWGAILISYIKLVSGMTLPDIYFLESCCVVAMILLQVPTGALADLLGRRRTIIAGTFLLLIETIVFGTAVNSLMIWIGNLFWVFGFSLISGADSALLYDTLKFLGREKDFRKIEGRAMAYRLALVASAIGFSGYLADINLRWPLRIDMVVVAICLLTTFCFVEAPNGNRRHQNLAGYLQVIRDSSLVLKKRPRVWWCIAFSVLLAVVGKLWFFTYNPYFEQVGLPLRHYGHVFLLLNLVAAIASYSSSFTAAKMGARGSILLLVGCISLPMIAMGYWIAVGAAYLVLFQNISRGYLGPFVGQLLQDELPSEYRATVGSFQSMCRALVESVSLASFGLILKFYPLTACLKFLGVTTLIVGLLLMRMYYRVWKSSS